MPTDPFRNTAASLITPAADCFAIEPQDDAILSSATKAIYVGTGGDIVLRTVQGHVDGIHPAGAALRG